MQADLARTAALQLWPQEPPAGLLDDREARRLLGPTRMPVPQPLRFVQALAARRGRLGWESDVAAPLAELRERALGAAAAGPPRPLVRVDEFPHAGAVDPASATGPDSFRRFHAVLAEAGVPYLLAVTPRVSRDYLDPRVAESRELSPIEAATLGELRDGGGVSFGLHGADHRTRHASPRRHSELTGLTPAATAARIDEARAALDRIGLETPAFVPPFNRFDPGQYALLAERFEVVCGGPESVLLLGFHRTPAWRGDAVYLPSYPPLYGTAATVAAEVERLLAAEQAVWAPITLHWGWELRDDLAGLRRLCALLRDLPCEWSDFLRAVRASRAAA